MASQARSVRPRSARGRGEDLRDELLDAAERRLLSTGSMDAVSIRSIVTDVGVSPPALYLHFDDKDDLFFAVCERRFADFGRALEAAGAGLDDPVERLRAMGNEYVRYGLDHAEHYQIMFGGAAATAEDRLGDDSPGSLAFRLLVDTVAEAMATGAFRTDDLMRTAMTIWSGVHGVVMLYLSKHGEGTHLDLPDAVSVQQSMCDTLLRGFTCPEPD